MSHSDFLISEKEKANIEGTGTDDTASGAWPIENVFVGKKEPDLADALITANILKEHKSRTPDSSEIVYFYRVNEDILKEAELGVMSGTLNSANSKCLQAPSDSNPVKWFVSHVADSNAFILVVDGYRRKDTEYTTNTTNPTNPALTFVVHNPDRIRIITRLAAVLIRLGDLIGAQNIWEKMIEQCVHDFGRDHPFFDILVYTVWACLKGVTL